MSETEWTVSTLKEYLDTEITRIRDENDRRFASQEKAVETAFNAAKEAVIKSEIGVEKRSDAVYVTISKLKDELGAVMPRTEAEQRFTTLTDKLAENTIKATLSDGVDKGSQVTWGKMVTLITVVGSILGIVILLANNVF